MRRCDIPNVCYSQPCPYNNSCIVRENGEFECICLTGWKCSLHPETHELDPWIVAAIALSGVVSLILVALFVVLLYVNLRKTDTEK